jgi:hypothetical protein
MLVAFDWPVYPRLAHTMRASTRSAIRPCGKRPLTPFERRVRGCRPLPPCLGAEEGTGGEVASE